MDPTLPSSSSASLVQQPSSGPAQLPPQRPRHATAGTGTGTGVGASAGASAGTASTGTNPRKSTTRALLTKALQEAQLAVQMDNACNIAGAIESYDLATTLLAKVIEATASVEEQERLQMIVSGKQVRQGRGRVIGNTGNGGGSGRV
ncbi:hypothetical protein B0O80DRAFT_275447 [Mortierella sp. GBAus27b]|nr:hypothetical protein B0O80DRAFT_275447 [Mortierella sp. GBAus27b]